MPVIFLQLNFLRVDLSLNLVLTILDRLTEPTSFGEASVSKHRAYFCTWVLEFSAQVFLFAEQALDSLSYLVVPEVTTGWYESVTFHVTSTSCVHVLRLCLSKTSRGQCEHTEQAQWVPSPWLLPHKAGPALSYDS